MKIDWNSKYNTIAVYALLVVALSLGIYGVVENFPDFVGMVRTVGNLLLPFIYGFAIAYILSPLLRFFERRVLGPVLGRRMSARGIRALGVMLTLLLALAAVALFGRVVIPQVISSIVGISVQVPDYIKHLETVLQTLSQQVDEIELTPAMLDNISSMIEEIWTRVYGYISQFIPLLLSFTVSFTSGLVKFIVGIIISIYVLLSKERFFAQSKKLLYSLLKKEQVDRIISITHESHEIFSGFINGKILDSLIIGVLCFAGMTLLRMPYAMLISVIVGITNVIPYFGPFIGAIPSALIVLMVDPVQMFWFVLFILVLQQFDGNILGPRILGETTGLSAFWVIFAILVFGGLFNVVGMFIGVPVFAVIYSLVRKGCESRLARRGLPVATEAYASSEHPIPQGRPRTARKASGSGKSKQS